MIQIQTVKPFPADALWELVKDVRRIVTVENHSVIGGLAGAVCEALAERGSHPPVRKIGVQDVFTQSGPTAQVKARYGLDGQHVVEAVKAP